MAAIMPAICFSIFPNSRTAARCPSAFSLVARCSARWKAFTAAAIASGDSSLSFRPSRTRRSSLRAEIERLLPHVPLSRKFVQP
jgi:hypothetical protein